MADYDSDLESVGSNDSDKELQIAFAQGLLKPGLNYEAPAPKTFINNVEGLKLALAELKKDLPWIERLDLTSTPIPAPKALEIAEGSGPAADDVHDDFKREMKFYRQAQAAVLEAIPRLHSLGIKTRRPDDYMAEMAKSDVHMKKVREKLLSKQIAVERSEKAKKMRELRKYGKKVQTEVLQQRQKEKRQMMEAVKKYRKGKDAKLDFLNDDMLDRQGKGQQQQQNKRTFQPNKKREIKNKKFGFGGQKKRSKHNTAGSSADMSDFNPRVHASRPTGKFKKAKQATKNRPGKNKRQKIKQKRR